MEGKKEGLPEVFNREQARIRIETLMNSEICRKIRPEGAGTLQQQTERFLAGGGDIKGAIESSITDIERYIREETEKAQTLIQKLRDVERGFSEK